MTDNNLKTLLLVCALAFVSCQSKTETAPQTQAPKVKAVQEKTPPKSEPRIYQDSEWLSKFSTFKPLQAIKDLDQQIESYQLGKDLSAEQKEKNRLLKSRIIRGAFDIEELCRLALSTHWEKIGKEQQEGFVDLMTQLLEKRAVFSKELLQGENKLYNISYLSEKITGENKDQALVKTRMNIVKEKLILDISYKMVKKDKGWKIYDVIVDEASMLSNYRYQFNKIIQTKGFENLVQRMQDKLDGIS